MVLWREEWLYSLRVLGGIYDQKQQSRKDNTMKDDEVENLFAYGWIDASIAIVIALLALVALFFFAGYLT